MSPISRGFVAKLESFVAQHGIPLVQFRKGERKDAVMAEHLRGFAREEGVVFVGKAQEKAPVFRTEKRRSPTTGRPYLWIVRSTAMVNHYYIYAVDCDFGPFFLKFCTYFPFNAKLCLNGHEYAKRQLTRQGIAFEALDNAFSVVPTPNACRRFAMGYRHRRSMPCCASGCACFRTLSPQRIAKPAIATTSRFCRPNSPHPVPATPRRLPLSRSAPAPCGLVRTPSRSNLSRRRHLSTAPPAPAPPDRACPP